jgi:hypothetical protein
MNVRRRTITVCGTGVAVVCQVMASDLKVEATLDVEQRTLTAVKVRNIKISDIKQGS